MFQRSLYPLYLLLLLSLGLPAPAFGQNQPLQGAQPGTVGRNVGNSVGTQAQPLLQEAIAQPLRIEIRLRERRATLYRGKTKLKSYPVAIGRSGWETPVGSFKVLQKIKSPMWIHPLTGEKVPGGHPDNPLGNYWIGFWTDGKNWVGFHGTPNPESVGRAVSHGCVRMYNADVASLFSQVEVGTPVTVVK